MANTIIFPFTGDESLDSIGIKHFKVESIIFIITKNSVKAVQKFIGDLEKFRITTKIRQINTFSPEHMFKAFSIITETHNANNLIVASPSSSLAGSIVLSAAYAFGIRAYTIVDNNVMMYPIMNSSYYSSMSKTKKLILQYLSEDTFTPLQKLAKGLNISISLASYHINGNPTYQGLKSLRLIEVTEKNKQLLIRLSSTGKVISEGLVPIQSIDPLG